MIIIMIIIITLFIPQRPISWYELVFSICYKQIKSNKTEGKGKQE